MQLLLKRAQRQAGMLGGKTVFILGIRAEYTEEERGNINRYNLGGQVIYDSQAAQRHFENVQRHADAGTVGGMLKGLGSLALAKMNLSVTLASLQRGHTVECRDLGELLECEQALVEACKNVKNWLDAAASFDGREILVDLDEAAAP
jgi:hypothetical protein